MRRDKEHPKLLPEWRRCPPHQERDHAPPEKAPQANQPPRESLDIFVPLEKAVEWQGGRVTAWQSVEREPEHVAATRPPQEPVVPPQARGRAPGAGHVAAAAQAAPSLTGSYRVVAQRPAVPTVTPRTVYRQIRQECVSLRPPQQQLAPSPAALHSQANSLLSWNPPPLASPDAGPMGGRSHSVKAALRADAPGAEPPVAVLHTPLARQAVPCVAQPAAAYRLPPQVATESAPRLVVQRSRSARSARVAFSPVRSPPSGTRSPLSLCRAPLIPAGPPAAAPSDRAVGTPRSHSSQPAPLGGARAEEPAGSLGASAGSVVPWRNGSPTRPASTAPPPAPVPQWAWQSGSAKVPNAAAANPAPVPCCWTMPALGPEKLLAIPTPSRGHAAGLPKVGTPKLGQRSVAPLTGPGVLHPAPRTPSGSALHLLAASPLLCAPPDRPVRRGLHAGN